VGKRGLYNYQKNKKVSWGNCVDTKTGSPSVIWLGLMMAQGAQKTSGGWGFHRQVFVLVKCMEDNMQMGKLMVGEMDG
jgi:hypothetical protein